MDKQESQNTGPIHDVNTGFSIINERKYQWYHKLITLGPGVHKNYIFPESVPVFCQIAFIDGESTVIIASGGGHVVSYNTPPEFLIFNSDYNYVIENNGETDLLYYETMFINQE